MVNLSKLFDDLVAVSQGNVERLSRATEQFTHDITQTSQIQSWPPSAAAPSAEPQTSDAEPPTFPRS